MLRGAYGIYYEADTFNGLVGVIPGGGAGAYSGTYNLQADPITPWRGIFNWDNGFPTDRRTAPQYDVSFGDKNATFGTDPDYGRKAYVQAWNINLQRQLISRFVLDIGYVGRKGTGLREGALAKGKRNGRLGKPTFGVSSSRPVELPSGALTKRPLLFKADDPTYKATDSFSRPLVTGRSEFRIAYMPFCYFLPLQLSRMVNNGTSESGAVSGLPRRYVSFGISRNMEL